MPLRRVFVGKNRSCALGLANRALLPEVDGRRRRSQKSAGFRRGCGAGEVSGDRVRTSFIQTMTRQSPE